MERPTTRACKSSWDLVPTGLLGKIADTLGGVAIRTCGMGEGVRPPEELWETQHWRPWDVGCPIKASGYCENPDCGMWDGVY